MKREFICLAGLFISLFFVVSCKSGSNYTQDVSGFELIQDDLKEKFGDDAYYTDISITNSTKDGNDSELGIHLIVTQDPNSLKMQEWVYDPRANWKHTADVTLEIPEGDNAKDFMYQLGGRFDLKKIGELVESSAQKVVDEKNIDSAALDMLVLKTPDNTDASETTIFIRMKPKGEETLFNFRYDLDGKLLSFDY